MDVSRYNFDCQKALHQGLQYARSFGHDHLEVEHIALALLRADAIDLGAGMHTEMQGKLQGFLTKHSKNYGNVTIEFGKRLNLALDDAEGEAGKKLVEVELLWECLLAHSKHMQEWSKRVSTDVAGNVAKEQATKVEPKEHEATDSFKLSDKMDEALKKYTLDLTEQARQGALDPVIGRDSEVRRVMEVLGRKKKNNPVLIGEPGVGKTAVAEALALAIAEDKVPDSVKNKRVLSLDLGSLISGARFRGEFEERMKDLLQAVQACKGQVILFVDEIHMLVGAGSAEGSADAANLMKPALARGELRCLGATTLDEYRKYIEKDSALERRFQVVLVEEPSRDDAIRILEGLRRKYEVHHGIHIAPSALQAAVDLSIRYLSHRRLPDKAIDLLDEACSRLRMQIDTVPDLMSSLREEIQNIEMERKAIDQADGNSRSPLLMELDQQYLKASKGYQEVEQAWRKHQKLMATIQGLEKKRQDLEALLEQSKQQNDYDFAVSIQNKELPQLLKQQQSEETKLKAVYDKHPWLTQEVNDQAIAQVIALWTKVPVSSVSKDESEQLLSLESQLERRVYGQSQAMKVLANAIRRARVGVNDPDQPLGVFLFIGPTGVGKTETAKAIAQEVFSNESFMVRVDMSEYMEKHNVSRLIGAPPGYVGHEEGGELTEKVRRTPYTVILLDEIEKAHPKVLDILLQVFDDGRLTDSMGRVVDFCNSIIIMTSNLAIPERKVDEEGAYDERVRESLAQKLRPEFVGRIDEVVDFKPLGESHFEKLIGKLLTALNQRIHQRGLSVALDESMKQHLLSRVKSTKFGGRALKRLFQESVVDRVSERILESASKDQVHWILALDEQGRPFWQDKTSPSIGNDTAH